MSAIIPIASSIARKRAFGAISPYVPAIRRQAFTAMGYAARYAARRIQRRWRGYRRRRYPSRKRRRVMAKKKQHFSRREVGEYAGSNTTKRFTILDATVVPIANGTLYQHELTAIPKTPDNDIDSRQRDMINCRGFKIYLHVNKTVLDRPTFFNVAVIAPKDNNLGPNPISQEKFFRGSGVSRALDFNNTILNGIDFNTRHINTDKYVILWHKRYCLGNPGGSTFTVQNPSYRMIKKWVGLKRQIRYDTGGGGEGTDTVTGAVYLVYWCADFGSAANSSIGNKLSHSIRCITYFREPRP